MAMTNRTEHPESSLKRRIEEFYRLLNQRDFGSCRQMIDPRVRQQPSSVTLFQYENSVRQLLDEFGLVKIVKIEVSLHLNEPNRLYEGRDFAVGKTTWADEAGELHDFSERWVREEDDWYTRSTGYVVSPTPAGIVSPSLHAMDDACNRPPASADSSP
jgi:hypothetical protein